MKIFEICFVIFAVFAACRPFTGASSSAVRGHGKVGERENDWNQGAELRYRAKGLSSDGTSAWSYTGGGVLLLGQGIGNKENYHQASPQYAYDYDVKDLRTGNIESHKEVHFGNLVKGQYSLNKAGSSVHVVDYTYDQHGFRVEAREEA